jgi:SAM-dependent methyltransferase
MNKKLEKLATPFFKAMARLASPLDRAFLSPDVAPTQMFKKWDSYLESLGTMQGLRVLEIGSREVTGPSQERRRFANAEYVGFDYYPGPNVEVVGDVHRLSSYFRPGEQFDLIFTVACFEHFSMPWLAAMEIAKMLKTGGVLLVVTHFSFGSHERPWNFFQFSDMGLRVLFSEALGFECIDAGMFNPLVGRYSSFADESVRYRAVRGLYAGSGYFGQKVKDEPAFDWSQVSAESVVSGTTYPVPRH